MTKHSNRCWNVERTASHRFANRGQAFAGEHCTVNSSSCFLLVNWHHCVLVWPVVGFLVSCWFFVFFRHWGGRSQFTFMTFFFLCQEHAERSIETMTDWAEHNPVVLCSIIVKEEIFDSTTTWHLSIKTTSSFAGILMLSRMCFLSRKWMSLCAATTNK